MGTDETLARTLERLDERLLVAELFFVKLDYGVSASVELGRVEHPPRIVVGPEQPVCLCFTSVGGTWGFYVNDGYVMVPFRTAATHLRLKIPGMLLALRRELEAQHVKTLEQAETGLRDVDSFIKAES